MLDGKEKIVAKYDAKKVVEIRQQNRPKTAAVIKIALQHENCHVLDGLLTSRCSWHRRLLTVRTYLHNRQ